MKSFTLALVALAGSADALKTQTQNQDVTIGRIVNNTPVNDDYHLVAKNQDEVMEKFLMWASETGTNYSDSTEMEQRLENWVATNQRINACNMEASAREDNGEKNPAHCNHNLSSDQSLDELYKKVKTFHDPTTPMDNSQSEEIGLAQNSSHVAATVDWTEHTLPVLNQGGCGSCWAFSGNTVLEGTDSIFSGNKKRLSQQYAVDCGGDYHSWYLAGCNGGVVYYQWLFYLDRGFVYDADYPYTGTQGSCDTTVTKHPASEIMTSTIGQVSSRAQAKQVIMSRPLNAAFAVGDYFFNYSYGLIKAGDNNCLPEGSEINHAMAIVGLDLIGEGNMIEETNQQLMARWKDQADYDNGCQNTQGNNEFTANGYEDFCLWWEDVMTPSYMAEGPYWKIQNSWGSDWGHDGFAYFEDKDPNDYQDGNCAMFRWGMEYINHPNEP